MADSVRARAARRAMDLHQGKDTRAVVSQIPERELRKLAGAARGAEVPEELIMLVRYQAKRDLLTREAEGLLVDECGRLAKASPDADPMPELRALLGYLTLLAPDDKRSGADHGRPGRPQ